MGLSPSSSRAVNAVLSVFGRTGAVVATSGDYTAAQVTNAADLSSASPQVFTSEVDSGATTGQTAIGPIGTAGAAGLRLGSAGPIMQRVTNTETSLSGSLDCLESLNFLGKGSTGRLGQVGPSNEPGLRLGGDSNFYRSAANVLKADSCLIALGIAANPITSGALPTVSPSSGTAFQCSTTRDVFLTVPVTFNPTAGAAATCLVQLSPDNVTFSALSTESIPAGITFDGTVDSVRLQVPAGWYVKLTVTNATLGTGTYY